MPVATLSVSAQVHPAVYSKGSLKGSYGYLLNNWLSDVNSQKPFAVLGIAKFDGLGSITYSYTAISEGGTASTGSGSGTYSVAKDGTGSINWTDSNGGAGTDALVLDSGGKSFQMVQTSCSNCDTSVLAGTAVAMGATSFTNASLKGNYEWMMTKWTSGQDGNADVTIGAAAFDGIGSVKGSMTDVFAGTPQSFAFTGTYSVNSDGSGSMTATANGSTVTIAFVINTASSTGLGAKGLQLLKTAESSGGTGVHTGTATKQ